jgi:hypothetical protein
MGTFKHGDVAIPGQTPVLETVVEQQQVGTSGNGSAAGSHAIASDPNRNPGQGVLQFHGLIAYFGSRVRGVHPAGTAALGAITAQQHGHPAATPLELGGQGDDQWGFACSAKGDIAN